MPSKLPPKDRSPKVKRKLVQPALPVQRHLDFGSEGRYYDLRAIFNKINAQYFRNRLRNYRILWGQKRRKLPATSVVFGTIQEDDRLIRINPRLDAPFVPVWFVEYVVYHEMLHAFVPDEALPNGRRRVHTEEFYRREKEFRFYRRARKWEGENLARFLR